MSIKILDQVLGFEGVTTAEKLVLIILADYADDNGVCWPSMETIARKALVTERSARRIIRRLEIAGYLETEVSKGRASSRYRVLLNPEQESTNPDRHSGFNPDLNDTNPDPRDTNPDPRCTQPGPGGPPNRHEPSKNLESIERATGCDAGSVVQFPEPGKRRDPSQKSLTAPRKRKAAIPENAVPSDRDYAAADRRNLSREEADAQFDRFKNHHLARGSKFVDWGRAWLTWLDSPYFRPVHGSGNGRDEARIRDAAEYARTMF